MRLVRYGPVGGERTAVLVDDTHARDLWASMPTLDGPTLARLGSMSAAELDGPLVELAGHRLGSPLARPGKIVCVGLNYADHARESGQEPPTEPVLFMKDPGTVVGPGDRVHVPPGAEKVDWEVELGVVIGRRARYLESPEQAVDHIAGYVVSHDVSERHYQLERGGQWDKGKSCETFNPVGPWLVTPDEVPDVGDLELWLDVNDVRMQSGSTADMIFGVGHLVHYISQFMVLEPGDLINTGTPAGVGLGQRPPRFLRPGDVVTLGISGLGSQRQELVPAPISEPTR